jgi:ergothioneine biosynthesis protein EgtB
MQGADAVRASRYLGGMPCPIPRTSASLASWSTELRRRTLGLVADLCDDDLDCEKLNITNPFLWELGHVGWFHERFLLRGNGEPSRRADADELFDSMEVLHDRRWDLPLPKRSEVLAYLESVHAAVLEQLDRGEPSRAAAGLWQLCLFHEEMHAEAFLYMRQTLGYAMPAWLPPGPCMESHAEPAEGDAEVPAGVYRIGAERDAAFSFDNERWAHDVSLESFRIARRLVSQDDFRAFVDDGGYRDERLWSAEGLALLQREHADHPRDWRRGADGWQRRAFERWVPLEPDHAVTGVSWHEAEAYCAWAGRRLPTETEWEAAAAYDPSGTRRRYPWGDTPPDSTHAVLDGRGSGSCSVHSCADGDSTLGLRQMIGNVWEWTASDFLPYDGFAPAEYLEYSEPWFGTRKVLRGGAWSTSSLLVRNTHRNFFQPWRRDVPTGFRTCAR